MKKQARISRCAANIVTLYGTDKRYAKRVARKMCKAD